MSKSKRAEWQVEFFLPKTGIVQEVLARDAFTYIGDAEIYRTKYDGKAGYLIKAQRAFTKEQHASLKKDSARWQASRESHRGSEVSSTGDEEGIVRNVHTSRRDGRDDRPNDRVPRVYYEPRPIATLEPHRGQTDGTAPSKYNQEIILDRDSERESSRNYPAHAGERLSSRQMPSVLGHPKNVATIRSFDGVKPYHDTRQGPLELPKKYLDERDREAVNEIVVPAMGSLKIEDHRHRRVENDSGRQKVSYEGPTRRSYHAGIKEDTPERNDFPDKGFDLIVDRDGNRFREYAKYGDSKPRSSSFLSDRPAKARNRKVLIDDLDSVAGSHHVVRDPKEPLSTRSQSLKESERSRRIREIGQREVAEEQASFRRQRSMEHLDLVREDDEGIELNEGSTTRRSYRPRKHYYDG
ncbi:MAG: hypothetical protein Q9160_001423 [Pyrenula sp. 1 TL-2023]